MKSDSAKGGTVSRDTNADTRYSFTDVQIVTTGISQLPRRDRANEMYFNCTLLTVVRRSLSSISGHHFHKTLSFLFRFRRLCKKHEKKNELGRIDTDKSYQIQQMLYSKLGSNVLLFYVIIVFIISFGNNVTFFVCNGNSNITF